MRFGDIADHPVRDLKVTVAPVGTKITMYFARKGARVEAQGVDLAPTWRGRPWQADLGTAVRVMNKNLPDYVAPVTEAEVLSHV